MKTTPTKKTPSVFGTDLIIAGTVGAMLFAVLLLHDIFVEGPALSHSLYLAFKWGGIAFVGMLAFLKMSTRLFPYIILVVMLALYFIH
jgi:hypothetical protein